MVQRDLNQEIITLGPIIKAEVVEVEGQEEEEELAQVTEVIEDHGEVGGDTTRQVGRLGLVDRGVEGLGELEVIHHSRSRQAQGSALFVDKKVRTCNLIIIPTPLTVDCVVHWNLDSLTLLQ